MSLELNEPVSFAQIVWNFSPTALLNHQLQNGQTFCSFEVNEHYDLSMILPRCVYKDSDRYTIYVELEAANKQCFIFVLFLMLSSTFLSIAVSLILFCQHYSCM